MIDNNHELTTGELDAVSGGFILGLANTVKGIVEQLHNNGGESGQGVQGGQGDPAQRFQQLLQQLTQGN